MLAARDIAISMKTKNSWKETAYLLASPANARRLRTAIAELNEGRRAYPDSTGQDEAKQEVACQAYHKNGVAKKSRRARGK
jgi:hypothetical protein